ncbi:putative exported protein [Halobacteriovorax marinus SJ]|uniref:Exported protein n=1 Tax=Halobacteriovorax marinus (strain ATCC BAA-682 / DSM 15412 / SJ) TaxID=862908 RepID=E1WYS5_HALMS|nr:hypothetical protein [Halobacteriovorax marinus]CBW27715.1 putative exported protein [Halobacteriovorax marinus SJ]
MKNILLIILTSLTLSVYADGEIDPFVETLDRFEKYCIDQNDELREDVYVSDEFFSCRDTMEYLQLEFKEREELMTSNPDVYRQFQDCVENRDKPKVIPFIAEIQEATDEVTCNESEKKEFEKNCGQAWECNKLRAIKDGAGMLPRVIRNPIQKYVRNTVQEKNYDSECIADGRSNCVKDFVYAFAANLWSSASSVWDLVSKGTKSLFDIGGWFDDEADKLHAKAIQSKKDVEDFWDNPGKWFSNLIDNIKKGVDDWVRTSVFCAKWEGKPQFSKCLQPLENYDCIDCDDKINATCVAIGAISSEVGVAFLTAGVGTAASLTARAGAKTLAVVATKVSSKVKTVAPSFAKSSKATKTTKASEIMAKTAAVVGTGLSKSTEIAKKIYSVSSEQALRIKDKMDSIAKVVTENKVVMVASEVIAKGNIPGRISEKIAEKGVLAGAKAVSKVGSGAVKADADKLVRVAQRARHSERAQQVLSERTHEKSRLSGHNAKATSLVRRGERASGSSQAIGGSSGGNSVGSHASSATSGSSTHGSENRTGRYSTDEKYSDRQRVPSQEGSHHQNSNQHPGQNQHQQAQNNSTQNQRASRDEARRQTEERRREEQRKVAEQKRKEEQRKAQEQHHSETEEKKSEFKVSKGAVAASLATHLAAKGVIMSNEQAEREAERIQALANGQREKFDNSLVSAKNVLGVDSSNPFSNQAMTQAQNVKEMYSDENKDNIVSEIQNSNKDLSRDQAEEIFNNRRAQVDKAYDYMDRATRENSSSYEAKDKVSATEELRNIGRRNQLNALGSELSNLTKQREAIESGAGTTTSSEITPREAAPTAERQIARADNEATSSRRGVEDEALAPVSSSASSSGSLSSAPSSVSSNNSSSDNSSYESSSPVASESNNDSVPSIVNNELIEEAINNSEKLEEKKTEQDEKRRSKDLKDLLSKIGDKPVKIESGVVFGHNLNSIKANSAESKVMLENLAKRVKASEKVDKLYTYAIGADRIELYQFDEEVFHIKISKNGEAEIIESSEGNQLINRSAFIRD